LGIDYGTVATRAVLAWPDGRWSGLRFDGADWLPSAVYVDADGVTWVGQSARERSSADPTGFVAYPKRHLGQTHLRVRDREIATVDLIAAVLHHVRDEAARVAGQPADEVTITVPAGWGPARRTVLRRAATRAGLPQPHLVDTPAAVASHLLATGTPIPIDAPILLCDFGAGRFEATVLLHAADGFEVLSTIDTTDAAGLALDTALANHVATLAATLVPPPDPTRPDSRKPDQSPPAPAAPPTPPISAAPSTAESNNIPVQNGPVQNGPVQNGPAQHGPAQHGPAQHGPAQHGPTQHGPTVIGADQQLLAMASAHAAIQTLAHAPAVAVPAAAGPPVVIDQPTLRALAAPVLASAGQVAQAAVAAADQRLDGLAGVYCHGGGVPTPLATTALTTALTTAVGDRSVPTVVAVPDAEQAAARGAVQATGGPAIPPVPPTPPGKPRIRHYAALLVPAVASVVLLVQATDTAYDVPDAGAFGRTLFVLANWGEYALAGLLAVQACLATAVLAAAHITRVLQKADPDTPPDTHRLLARFLPAAAATGVAIAGLYGVIGAVWHQVPEPPFLRATLWTAVPTAVLAVAIGLLAARRPNPPADNWLDWLTTPPLAIALAATGIYLIQYSYQGVSPGRAALYATAPYFGAALYGVGAALTLPVPRPYQVLATPPLVLAAVVLAIGHARTTLAAVYTLTVLARYATRATQLAITSANRAVRDTAIREKAVRDAAVPDAAVRDV
jgi:hypothetical protein